MTQIAIGKELPNLKITLGNDFKGETLEDGELLEIDPSDNCSDSKIEDQGVSVHRKFTSPLEAFRKYENFGGGFITGLDLSSEAVTKKLEDRAVRFGVEERPKKPITHAEIDALYKSLDINVENNSSSSKSKNIRLDAIHMRGVEEMSTNDIFDYFKEYGPASVEWINDYSCNVVWLDEAGAARALLGLSRVLIIQKKPRVSEDVKTPEIEAELPKSIESDVKENDKAPQIEEVIIMSDFESDDDDDNDISLKHQAKSSEEVKAMEVDENQFETKSDIDVPVPPGHWRLGIPHTKAKAILLRFATRDDKKLPGAEKRSHYYKKYGNPNYGGMRGLITTTRKRKIIATKNKIGAQHISNKADSESKIDDFPIYMQDSTRTKRVRMRMYADDEEERLLKKADSAERAKKKSNSVHNRLGKSSLKIRAVIRESDEEKEDNNYQLKEPKLSKLSSRYNVWTRLAHSMAKESEDISEEKTSRKLVTSKDLRNKLNSLPLRNQPKDLRSKLNRKHNAVHRSPLVVDIENDTYSD